MSKKYPFYGHDDGLVIDGPDTGFAERPMTAAELAAREPALKIARDIYRHANQAGVCYAEIWRTIADAFDGPQAPIAQLTINQAGEIAGTLMYAPGLPPGDHDLYCEPEAVAPYLRAQPAEQK